MLDLRALGERRELQTSAGPIHYRERGEGSPVVFLHGIVANGALWRDVVPAIESRVRCITPDWPLGSHRAPMKPGTDFSLPGLARLVAEVFERLELDDVTLVANDTGGAIAQWVAVQDPPQLGRLVLTPCDAFDNFLPLLLRHLQLAGRHPAALRVIGEALRLPAIHRLPLAFGALTVRPIDRDAMHAYTEPLRTVPGVRDDFAALVRAVSSRYTREAAQRLGGFGKPALVVWSSQDRLFPMRHGHELAHRLPNGRFEVVHDAGAFIPEDRPRELAARIDAFLAEQLPAAAGAAG